MMLGLTWVWDLRLFKYWLTGEQENTNYFEILPFHGMTNYDIECEYTRPKKKLLDTMDNDEFQTYLKKN